MPAGATAIGYAAFAAVKAVGYTGAAYYLSRGYRKAWSARKKITVGLTRTAIGIVVGVSFGLSWGVLFSALKIADDWGLLLYYGLLFPVRIGEWYLLLWLFFDREQKDRLLMLAYALKCTFLSYALDLIAVVSAFVVPGGLWIC